MSVVWFICLGLSIETVKNNKVRIIIGTLYIYSSSMSFLIAVLVHWTILEYDSFISDLRFLPT